MASSLWILTRLLPQTLIADVAAERLAYAVKANIIAVLPLFVMLAAIGNARFLSDAIDPTRRAESRSMEIDGRVADNTLQQNFIFTVASLALSTVGTAASGVGMRDCVRRRPSRFLVGYRINPL